MRATIAQAALLRAVTATSKVLGDTPDTSGLLITAQDGSLSLQATSGTVSTTSSSAANVEEDGKAVVSGKTMASLAKGMPDCAITLETEDASVVVRYGRAKARLNGIDPESFPEFVNPSPDVELCFPTGLLARMARTAIKATYRENDKPQFRGVCVDVGGGRLSMSASDTYRVVLMDAACEECGHARANVPAEHLKAIVGMPTLGDDVLLGFSDGRMSFGSGSTTTVSDLIGRPFPDVRKVMPEGDVSASVVTEELREALVRVGAMTHDDPRVTLSTHDGELVISASSRMEGAIREYVPAVFSGEFGEATVSVRFLLDAVEAMDDETILQPGPERNSPLVLRSSGEFDVMYLVMPMRR